MRATRRHTAGFTLIELMIVVAILGIIAAVAIPTFLNLMHKSKRAEAVMHLGEITRRIVLHHNVTKQLPQDAATFPTVSPCTFPDGIVPGQPQSAWWADPGWAEITYHIEDAVRFQYAWDKTSDTSGVASAVGDTDCDGVPDIHLSDITVADGTATFAFTFVDDD